MNNILGGSYIFGRESPLPTTRLVYMGPCAGSHFFSDYIELIKISAHTHYIAEVDERRTAFILLGNQVLAFGLLASGCIIL